MPFVDERYRTLAGGRAPRDRRQVERRLRRDGQPDAAARTSSAGLATHAGDALFEMCYLPEFRKSVRALRDHYDGSFERFWEDFRSRGRRFAKDTDHDAPERLLHGRLLLGRRGRHGAAALRHRDRRAAARDLGALARVGPGADGAEAGRRLRSLKAIYIDCGKRDQFFLDLGRRGVPPRARGDRRDGLLLRALRRDALGDRVPLSARGRSTWRSACRDRGAGGSRPRRSSASTRARDAAGDRPAGRADRAGVEGAEDQGRRRRGGRGGGRARDRARGRDRCCSRAATGWR